jgi:MFS family permease
MTGDFAEFRRGWRELLAATVGLATGFACYSPITSLFFRALEHDFGWSKTAAAASLIGLPVTALCMPFAGRLLDRFGVRRVALVSALLLTGCFIWLARMDGSLAAFYAGSIALVVLGCATGPISYTRTIAATFPRSRGLALALVLLGVSGTAVIMPLVIGPTIATQGWRTAYVILAAVAAAGGLLAFLLARRAPMQGASKPTEPATDGSLNPRQALATPAFWLLGAAIFGISLAGLGFVSQFQSLAIEHGLTAASAPVLLSVLAGSVCVSRIFVGFALDRLAPHRVAGAAIAVAGLGLALLLVPGAPLWPTGVLLGFGVGAELDLMSFFCARRFGMAHYGTIYGLLGVFFYGGLAGGAIVYAAVHDLTHSYQGAVALGAVIMFVSTALLLAVGPRSLTVSGGERGGGTAEGGGRGETGRERVNSKS